MMLESERLDGLSPIPWTALARFAEFFEFDEYQRDMFFNVMPIADGIVRKERKSKEDGKSN